MWIMWAVLVGLAVWSVAATLAAWGGDRRADHLCVRSGDDSTRGA